MTIKCKRLVKFEINLDNSHDVRLQVVQAGKDRWLFYKIVFRNDLIDSNRKRCLISDKQPESLVGVYNRGKADVKTFVYTRVRKTDHTDKRYYGALEITC